MVKQYKSKITWHYAYNGMAMNDESARVEGVKARTEMAENIDQVVGLGGRLIILCYALRLKLRND